jgi:hypothetical protein
MIIKKYIKTIIPLFLFSLVIFSATGASAFNLNDLSSAVDSTTKAAKGATQATDLLNDAQSVYSGFSTMTEKTVDAQVTTMSLIKPEKQSGLMSELNGFNSESGFSKVVKLTSFSQLMDSELDKIDLASGLTKVVTEPEGRKKAMSVLTDLKSAYSSGKGSVSKAKSLYSSITEFTSSPSAEGVSGTVISKLKDYSGKILPYIIEKGPERLEAISGLIKTFSSVL